MAAETPGGREVEKRRRERLDLTRSADRKYYASGDVSALSGGTGGDHRGRPGEPPAPAARVRRFRHNDPNTDRYYADLTLPTPAGPTSRELQRAALAPSVPGRPAVTAHAGVIRIKTAAGIPDAIDQAVMSAEADTGVVVTVPSGDKVLMQRLRTAVDLACSRANLEVGKAAYIRLAYAAEEKKPAATTGNFSVAPAVVPPVTDVLKDAVAEQPTPVDVEDTIGREFERVHAVVLDAFKTPQDLAAAEDDEEFNELFMQQPDAVTAAALDDLDVPVSRN